MGGGSQVEKLLVGSCRIFYMGRDEKKITDTEKGGT